MPLLVLHLLNKLTVLRFGSTFCIVAGGEIGTKSKQNDHELLHGVSKNVSICLCRYMRLLILVC